LLGSPMLLVLDEPTSGLDPRWARVLKDIMLEVNAKGTTVFFSSHLLSEVQELCNRVAILNNGGLVVENTMAAVSSGQAQKPKLVIRVSSDPEAAVGALKEKGFAEAYAHGNVITVHCDTKDKAGVLSALTSAKVTIEDFRTEEASLEDAFMKYIGAGGDAGGKLDAP
jgi:ABC-2 type transport system ATP-binding protein